MPDRSEMVATFLAMLELIKSRRIRISEDGSRVCFNRELGGPLEPPEPVTDYD